MKSLLVFVCCFALLAACQRTAPDPTPGGTPLNLSSSRFGAESSAFAFEFFKTLLAAEKPTANVVASPLSLHVALGMLLNGAEGKTADELLAALRLKGYSPEQYNQIYRELTEGLPNVDRRVTVTIANSVWHRQQVPVEAAYIETLRGTFGADVKPLSPDPAPINRWVEEKTRGKITKMFESVDGNLVLLLLNAVYFKGDWKYKFEEKDTEEAPFTLLGGRRKQVPMMRQAGDFRHVFTPGYAAVELPYGAGDYRMTVVLPNAGTDVTAFADTFGPASWDNLQSQLRESGVIVKLPRFEFEYEHGPDINAVLQALGVRQAFSRWGAGLTKIRKDDDLRVSQVRQKAYIKTDEKGSEAAAVTSIGVVYTVSGPPPSPPTFLADRPFLFFISEKNSNTVLFAGRVAEP